MEKKIPQRQCLGCNVHAPKNELLRVLRTPDGTVVLDFTGKKSGRGAYICKNVGCFTKAKKSGRIARNLDCDIPEAVYEALAAEIAAHD